MRVAVAGAGAFGIKHLDGLRNIDGVEVTSIVSRQLAQARRGRRKVRRRPRLDRPRRGARPRRRRRGDPVHAHPDARRPGDRRHAGRQARAGGDPARRQLGGRGRGQPCPTGDRARLHGRAHPPVQPVPSMGPPPHPRRRAVHLADGRADVLLPPHQHERARPAAKLDGQPAVAPRRPHRRPLPVPDRGGRGGGQRGAGPGPPRARHRHGHVGTAPHDCGKGLHAVVELQQRRTPRHVLSLHLRQRHLPRPLRRVVQRQRRADRRVESSTCR